MAARVPKKPPPHRHLFKLVPLKNDKGYVAMCSCGALLQHVLEYTEKKA